jgi:hypothetical protein
LERGTKKENTAFTAPLRETKMKKALPDTLLRRYPDTLRYGVNGAGKTAIILYQKYKHYTRR